MEDLLPIGQFSAASRLSQRALRLYDENGLLPPARTDPDSGYRYYARGQLREATLIRLLRHAGMPLAEIRVFVADPSEGRLAEYESGLVDELAARRRVLRYLRRTLEEESMFHVATKDVPEIRYVGRTARTKIDGLVRLVVATLDDLLGAAEPAGDAFTLYHGPVNEQDDGPIEVCVPSADGDRTLPAAEVAYVHVSWPQTEYPQVLDAYEAIWTWAKEHGREPDGPPREIYIGDREAGGKPPMEIAWPLRRVGE